jgi:hypothetical protein
VTSAVFQLDLSHLGGTVELFLNGQHDQVSHHAGERLGFVRNHPLFDRPMYASFYSQAKQSAIALSGNPADDPVALEGVFNRLNDVINLRCLE